MGIDISPFQSTHSLRSATRPDCADDRQGWVSIHALLAECDKDLIQFIDANRVSIHALLAECDRPYASPSKGRCCFNPRTPCGVRQELRGSFERIDPFQSTHSLRSATCDEVAAVLRRNGFNPRTPCGVRRHVRITDGDADCVSIHALLAECDCAQPYTLLLNKANHTLRQPP